MGRTRGEKQNPATLESGPLKYPDGETEQGDYMLPVKRRKGSARYAHVVMAGLETPPFQNLNDESTALERGKEPTGYVRLAQCRLWRYEQREKAGGLKPAFRQAGRPLHRHVLRRENAVSVSERGVGLNP